MQKFNYHTHTYRCGHADYNMSDEDFVKEFINAGFEKIAFTDHAPQKENIDYRNNMRMKYIEKDEYLDSIKNLKEKYKSIINIETGYEIEYLPGQEENIFELKNEVDKIVLGQHYIYNDDNKSLKIFRYHIFEDSDLIKYATYIRMAIERNIPDIIVHPDLYMLSRDKFGETEREVANIICSAAEEYNIPLEINLTEASMYLQGIKRDIKYPCKGFWKVAKNYNVKVLYGIDAHYKEQIRNYEESIKLVNEIIGTETIKKLNFINNSD